MSETVRKRLIHALLSLLLSVGLLMPLLGILHPSFLSPAVLPVIAVVILVFECLAISRVTALVGSGVCIAGLLVWLFGFGGLLTVSDTVVAVALRLSGIHTALPLVVIIPDRHGTSDMTAAISRYLAETVGIHI